MDAHIDANIIIDNGNVLPIDAVLLFSNSDTLTEEVHIMPANTTFADILVKFAIFPSKGQAKKNGWDKPIPLGWSEITVGKLKHSLWIWNPDVQVINIPSFRVVKGVESGSGQT